jgi:hypothetical protein
MATLSSKLSGLESEMLATLVARLVASDTSGQSRSDMVVNEFRMGMA